MRSVADRIVDRCDHDPPENVDPHPRLFSDLDDGRTSDALFKLWQKGIVDAEYDEVDEATRWRLSYFGVELIDRGLLGAYVHALEDKIQIDAPASLRVDLREGSR